MTNRFRPVLDAAAAVAMAFVFVGAGGADETSTSEGVGAGALPTDPAGGSDASYQVKIDSAVEQVASESIDDAFRNLADDGAFTRPLSGRMVAHAITAQRLLANRRLLTLNERLRGLDPTIAAATCRAQFRHALEETRDVVRVVCEKVDGKRVEPSKSVVEAIGVAWCVAYLSAEFLPAMEVLAQLDELNQLCAWAVEKASRVDTRADLLVTAMRSWVGGNHALSIQLVDRLVQRGRGFPAAERRRCAAKLSVLMRGVVRRTQVAVADEHSGSMVAFNLDPLPDEERAALFQEVVAIVNDSLSATEDSGPNH